MGWLMLGGAVVCLVIIPLVGGLSTSRQRRRASARRKIEQRETTAIAALRDGEQAKIRGVVAAREPLLKSPISGRACIGYHVFIDDQSHDPDYSWPGVFSREIWPSFLVTDETGTVAVAGELQMLVDPSDGGQALPPAAYDLLKQNDVRMRDLTRPRQFWFRETLLKEGDRVCVVGRPSRAIGAPAGASSRDSRPPYVMRGTYDEPIAILDDDRPAGPPIGAVAPLQYDAAGDVVVPPVRGPSRRAVEERETTAIAALEESWLSKITGVVAAREPLLTSPVSGRTSVGYRIVVDRKGQGWEPVVTREAWPSFLVTDDSGTAAVEGPLAIRLDPDDGAWASLPPAVYALLDQARVPASDMLGRDEEFRFQETLLEAGDRVSVFGRASLEIDAAGRGSFREPPRLHVFRGSEDEPVAVIDDEEPLG